MAEQGIGLYKVQGIVLRGSRFGEADRVVTLFTQSHGRIRAIAKGARRSKSRFGGRLEAFTLVDVVLYKGRSDLDTITQADIVERSHTIRDSYPAFCAASAMADAVDRTTPIGERNVRVFMMLRSALRALETQVTDPTLLAYAFLAKLSSAAGLHPMLERCVDCGAAEMAGFSHERGGAVCRGCLDRSEPTVSADALALWTSMLEADWDGVRRYDDAVRRETARLVLGFAQWHTESAFRAFSMLPTPA